MQNRFITAISLILLLLILSTAKETSMAKHEYNQLTAEEKRVILHKGTEPPFSGEYDKFFEDGLYLCRQCDAQLYRSTDKFNSGCGWPSFDDEIKGAIRHEPDADGRRIEILCKNCDGHLGHVFTGEQLTEKDTRHCVNSLSIKYVSQPESIIEAKAYVAGGCFWGVEFYLSQIPGVISAISGYMGGHVENPEYREICNGDTGHLEVVKINYDPQKISYRELIKYFFEIHDPTQENGQGPDIGEQYKSAVFCQNEKEIETVSELISILEAKGLQIVTQVKSVEKFWEAENYHQDYYDKTGKAPYCHSYVKRF
jgi:peptide methionine sulfoxide reductase msrA/msrB